MKKFLSVAALGVAAGVFALASCNNDAKPTTTGDTPVTTTEAPKTTTEKPTTTQGTNAAEELLNNLIFQSDGQAVTGEVHLPAYLVSGEEKITVNWSADSELITIATTVEENKDYFVGTVTRPENETATINLTASIRLGDDVADAHFTIRVNPYTIDDVVDAFKFEQDGATVPSDFVVPTTFEFNNETVTIEWSVPAASAAILSIAEDGKTVNVVQQETRKRASIDATFTYKNTTAKRTYRLNVYHERTAEELLHAFYDEPGAEAFTLKGYVIHKAGFDPSYGNGFLYLADQSLKGGYYVYRAYCDEDVWNQLEIGTQVEIPACKSTNYQGLIEVTQNKANIVSITTDLPALTTEQLAVLTNGFAADDLFVINGLTSDDSIKYHTGERVTLSSWKVVAVNSSTTATSGGTLATIEKGGVQATVVLSKYATALTTDSATPAVNAVNQAKTLSVGDYVNVSGILSNNANAYCIYVSDATTFTKTTDDANASLVKTKDLLAPISEVEALLPDALTDSLSIDLDTLTIADGVTFTLTIDDEIATVSGNVTTINPTATGKNIDVVVTAVKDGLKITKTFTVFAKAMSAAEKVAAEKEAYALEISEFGEYELAAAGATYSDVVVTYAIKTDASNIASLNGNKLTILSVDEPTVVELTVTFKLGTTEETKDVTLTIANGARLEVKAVTAPAADKTYYLGMYQNQLQEQLYATGSIASNRLATTTDLAKAIAVTAEESEGKYAFKFANGKYITLNSSGKLELGDEAFYWTYNATLTAWTAKAGTTDYFFGSYNQYDTISASNTSYLPGANQHIGNLYEVQSLTKTREEKTDYEFAATAAKVEAEVDSGSVVELPVVGSVFEDVVATYEATGSNASLVKIEDGTITFGTVSSATTVTMVAHLKCGSFEKDYPFYFEIQPIEFLGVTEAVAAATVGENIYIKGIVTSKSSNLCWITDGTTDFEVYGALASTSPVKYGDIKPGDVILVSGKYKIYNDATLGPISETDAGATIYEIQEATNAQKVMMTVNELALKDYDEDVTAKQLDTTGTTYSDVALSWRTKQDYGETVTVADNKITVKQGSEDVTVTLIATVSIGTGDDKVEQEKEVTFVVKKISATKVATTSLPAANITYNSDPVMVYETEDYAETLGLNTTIFDVFCTKGSGNGVAFYTTDVRLYGHGSKEGGAVTFTVAEGYRIDSIVITYTSEANGANAQILKGTEVLTKAEDGSYVINGSTFTIKDVCEGTTQVRFSSIEITYTKLPEE